MRDWPPITEPELLERLALGDEEFRVLLFDFVAALGQRQYRPELLARALSYPYERPAGSYFLDRGRVASLSDLDPAARKKFVEEQTAARHPILAFGGNGAPDWLEAKFAHFTSDFDRQVLVLTGYLDDIDVGASASISPFGSMPGAIFRSPGTSVRAAIVWCTDAQVAQLTWSELPYRLGRLDDARFTLDDSDAAVENIFAYVHRFGAFCVEGKPIALGAIPARNRKATAFTQQELLDLLAPRLIRPGARAEDLVRAIWDNMNAVLSRSVEEIWPFSEQLQAPWTPYPTGKRSN